MSEVFIGNCPPIEVTQNSATVEVELSPVAVEVEKNSNTIIDNRTKFAELPVFPNSQADLDGGLSLGDLYRTREGFLRRVIE